MAENGAKQLDVKNWPSPRELAYVLNQAGLDANASSSIMARRSDLAHRAGYQFGTDRDLYKVLGYKRQLAFDDYLAKYERQDVAGRIVDAPAEDTWREPPVIFDGEQDDTPFVREITALFDRLDAWAHLENADALAGIGHFGILLIGVSSGADEAELSQVVERAGAEDVIYLRAYDEGTVSIKTVDSNANSPRFMLPETYEVDLGEEFTQSETGSITTKVTVHWSRVIHIAENARRSLVYGAPRMRGVYNRLDDLEKAVGGSSEAFWKLVYKGIILSLKDGFAPPSDQDEEDELKSAVQDYVNDLRRFLFTPGYDVNELGGQTVDPSGMVDVIISIISGKTGIPKRILLGSEMGQLASSQDAANWAGRITGRRTKFAEPIILKPLIMRLVAWGAVKPPKGEVTFEWAPLFELTELEQADVADKYAAAFAKLTGGFPQAAVSYGEFRETWTPLSRDMKEKTLDDFDAVDALPAGSIGTPEDVK